MIISQVPVKNWHEIIGDKTIADTICDRLVYTSHKINLKGKFVRKFIRKKKKSEKKVDIKLPFYILSIVKDESE